MKQLNSNSQNGLTLVEMMIGVTLSVFLLGGVINVFISSKQTYKLQTQLGTLYENERLAMFLLNRDIRMAGYMANAMNDPITAFDSTNTSNGANSLSDTVAIRYESAVDCLNQATPIISDLPIAINRYYIENEQLMCLGNGGLVAEAIVDGVVNMQVLYGINTDALSTDTYDIANSFINAGDLAVSDWSQIKSVRIAMLFSSAEELNIDNSAKSDTLLDAPKFGPYSDGRRYHSFTTTINLRNTNI